MTGELRMIRIFVRDEAGVFSSQKTWAEFRNGDLISIDHRDCEVVKREEDIDFSNDDCPQANLYRIKSTGNEFYYKEKSKEMRMPNY